MKKLLILLTPFMAIFYLSCTDKPTEELETRDQPLRWGPRYCNLWDGWEYVGTGVKCGLDERGGCKWPTICKAQSRDFVDLAITIESDFNSESWGEQEPPVEGYDLLVQLWLDDPDTFYHPDSIPPDTIQ